jgi:hypothetical protein
MTDACPGIRVARGTVDEAVRVPIALSDAGIEVQETPQRTPG